MNSLSFIGTLLPALALLALAECRAQEIPNGMALIPGGNYQPPFAKTGKPKHIESFLLDITPVTNAEYLIFVAQHPQWRRSQARRIFADENYLKHWSGDLEVGANTGADAPVTNISWFAARAYLKAQGKRLPSTDEWEFAARASATQADASRSPEFARQVLEWYAKPANGKLPPVHSASANFFGLRGMHGLVWEWVRDFNNAITTGESRDGGQLDRQFFCGAGALQAVDPTDYAAFMRFAFRSSLRGNYCVGSLGFRGAKSLSDIPPQ